MTLTMTEQVQELRREIAGISKHRDGFVKSGRKDVIGRAERDEHVQRLQEIKTQLLAFNAWKK
jgi:hypothetical protein